MHIQQCSITTKKYDKSVRDEKDIELCSWLQCDSAKFVYYNPSGTPEFISGFSEVLVTRSLVLCACFVDRCLSFFFFWPLRCLFVFDLQILITLLVSSHSSHNNDVWFVLLLPLFGC
jgi:hypothetical protein